MTVEEFETLTALTGHLFPGRRNGRPGAAAALFDSFLHDSKRSSHLPLDIQNIRAGLQLLNFDALRLCNQAFARLSSYQQEALLQSIQSERDIHWSQLSARRWYSEISRISAELIEATPEFFVDTQRTA